MTIAAEFLRGNPVSWVVVLVLILLLAFVRVSPATDAGEPTS